MKNLQFRVLYREFLFRIVDLELLSAHAEGDSRTLLGQFASLLISCSVILTVWAGLWAASVEERAPASPLISAWTMEHFLVATTMLVVGLFARAELGIDIPGPPRRSCAWRSARPRAHDVSGESRRRSHRARSHASGAARSGGYRVAPGAGAVRFHARSSPGFRSAAPAGERCGFPRGDESRYRTDVASAQPCGQRRRRGHCDRRFRARRAARDDLRRGESPIPCSRSAPSPRHSRACCWRKWQCKGSWTCAIPCATCCRQAPLPAPTGFEITLLDLATHHSGLPRYAR